MFLQLSPRSTIFGNAVQSGISIKKIGALIKNEDVQTRFSGMNQTSSSSVEYVSFTNDRSIGSRFKTRLSFGVVCLQKIQNSKINSSTHHKSSPLGYVAIAWTSNSRKVLLPKTKRTLS